MKEIKFTRLEMEAIVKYLGASTRDDLIKIADCTDKERMFIYYFFNKLDDYLVGHLSEIRAKRSELRAIIKYIGKSSSTTEQEIAKCTFDECTHIKNFWSKLNNAFEKYC